jgi:hypothetical protein
LSEARVRHIDSVWPEAELAARELAHALEKGASPEVVRTLDEHFTRLDQAWRDAVHATASRAPEAPSPPR